MLKSPSSRDGCTKCPQRFWSPLKLQDYCYISVVILTTFSSVLHGETVVPRRGHHDNPERNVIRDFSRNKGHFTGSKSHSQVVRNPDFYYLLLQKFARHSLERDGDFLELNANTLESPVRASSSTAPEEADNLNPGGSTESPRGYACVPGLNSESCEGQRLIGVLFPSGSKFKRSVTGADIASFKSENLGPLRVFKYITEGEQSTEHFAFETNLERRNEEQEIPEIFASKILNSTSKKSSKKRNHSHKNRRNRNKNKKGTKSRPSSDSLALPTPSTDRSLIPNSYFSSPPQTLQISKGNQTIEFAQESNGEIPDSSNTKEVDRLGFAAADEMERLYNDSLSERSRRSPYRGFNQHDIKLRIYSPLHPPRRFPQIEASRAALFLRSGLPVPIYPQQFTPSQKQFKPAVVQSPQRLQAGQGQGQLMLVQKPPQNFQQGQRKLIAVGRNAQLSPNKNNNVRVNKNGNNKRAQLFRPLQKPQQFQNGNLLPSASSISYSNANPLDLNAQEPTWNHPFYKKYTKAAKRVQGQVAGFIGSGHKHASSKRDSSRHDYPIPIPLPKPHNNKNRRIRSKHKLGPPRGGGNRYSYPKSAHNIQDILNHFQDDNNELLDAVARPSKLPQHNGGLGGLSSEFNDVRFSLLRDIKEFAKRPNLLQEGDSSHKYNHRHHPPPPPAPPRRSQAPFYSDAHFEEASRQLLNTQDDEDHHVRNEEDPPFRSSSAPLTEDGFDEIFNPKPKPVRAMITHSEGGYHRGEEFDRSRERNRDRDRESSKGDRYPSSYNNREDFSSSRVNPEVHKKEEEYPLPSESPKRDKYLDHKSGERYPSPERERPYRASDQKDHDRRDGDRDRHPGSWESRRVGSSSSKGGSTGSIEDDIRDRNRDNERLREQGRNRDEDRNRERDRIRDQDRKREEERERKRERNRDVDLDNKDLYASYEPSRTSPSSKHRDEDPFEHPRERTSHRNSARDRDFPKSIRDKIRDASLEYNSRNTDQIRKGGGSSSNKKGSRYGDQESLLYPPQQPRSTTNRPVVLKRPYEPYRIPPELRPELDLRKQSDLNYWNHYAAATERSAYDLRNRPGGRDRHGSPVAVLLPPSTFNPRFNPHHSGSREDEQDSILEIHAGPQGIGLAGQGPGLRPFPSSMGRDADQEKRLQKAYLELLQHKMQAESAVLNSALPPSGSKPKKSPMRMKIHIYPNEGVTTSEANVDGLGQSNPNIYGGSIGGGPGYSASHSLGILSSPPGSSRDFDQFGGTLRPSPSSYNLPNFNSNRASISANGGAGGDKGNKNLVLHLHVHRRNDQGPIELEAEASEHHTSTVKPLTYKDIFEDDDTDGNASAKDNPPNDEEKNTGSVDLGDREPDKSVSMEVPIHDDKIEDVLHTLLQFRDRESTRKKRNQQTTEASSTEPISSTP